MNDFVGILLLAFILLVLPWLLLARSRQQREKAKAEFDLRWAEITRRVSSLENTVDQLRSEPHSIRTTGVEEAREYQQAASEPAMVMSNKTVAVEQAIPVSPIQPAAVQASASSSGTGASTTVEKTIAEVFERADHSPKFASIDGEEKRPWFKRLKCNFDLEETLGTNWLNKIGIIILVFGIAFFLAYQLREVGPAGKIAVGFITSAALLGGGLFLERKPRYAILARAGVGGGWALAFFTTYAMYHVQPAKLLSSQGIDLLLMGVVAAGMVAHSLRYRSQVVTGLAFFLGFSTVTISHVTVYSLTAGVVLSIALVVIVLRLQWYELEIFGLLAAYLNHFRWLWQIIEPMHGHKHPFAEFVPSAIILVLYWLTFRASYIIRTTESRKQELLATAAALLNSFGLLGLFKYQSVHPEWAFWALLAVGTVEICMSLVAKRRRQQAFAVLASIGVVLVFAAVPFRFSGMNVSVLWVAASQTLLVVGVATRENVFRRLSFAGIAAATGQMLSIDVSRVFGVRMDGAIPGRSLSLGFALVFASVIYYADCFYVSRRWSDLFDELDRRILRDISYGAMLLVAAGIWVALPTAETAPAWAAAALALGVLAQRTASADLKIQTDLLTAAAFIRALSINLLTTATWGHVSKRFVTVVLCAAAFYFGSRTNPLYAWGKQFHIPAAYTWIGSTLVGLLLWYELHSVSVAAGWALFGLVLMEVGLGRSSFALRAQAYVALVCSVTRIFIANLAAAGQPGEISPRLYSTLPVIAILFYLYARLRDQELDGAAFDRSFPVSATCAWAGLACFVGLIRFELPADWVAVAWAALVPILLAIALRTGSSLFLQQGMVMVFVTVFRGGLHNLYDRSLTPAPFWYSRKVCVGATCVLLFASLTLAYKLKETGLGTESTSKFKRLIQGCLRHPQQTLFFPPYLLLIGLLGVEMSKGMLTVSWSIFGVLTFLFALWIGERSFRLAGLGLLLAGVGKIVAVDVWRIGARDRYLTLITMGAALLLVSFLYSRFRDTIRQYL